MPRSVGLKPRKKFARPDCGAAFSTTVAAAAVRGLCGWCTVGGGCSLYIILHIERRVLRFSTRVSKARRTLMTSSGYVKKTDTMPAMLPEMNRRPGVSCPGCFITRARICSYARNLMPA